MLKGIMALLHRHKWQATGTNQWFVVTRQVCHCGLDRHFEFPLPSLPIDVQMKRKIDVRWTHGYWVRSDGKIEEFKETF